MLRRFVIPPAGPALSGSTRVLQRQHDVADDYGRDDEYQRRPEEAAAFAQLQQLGADHRAPGDGREASRGCREGGHSVSSKTLGDLQEALLERDALGIEFVDDDALAR